MSDVVLDASALIDLVLNNDRGVAAGQLVAGDTLHAPAHIDLEALSALGRMSRDGSLDADDVEERLQKVADAPIERHVASDMLIEAWAMRGSLRLSDAIYIVLARRLDTKVVTTDDKLSMSMPDLTIAPRDADR